MFGKPRSESPELKEFKRLQTELNGLLAKIDADLDKVLTIKQDDEEKDKKEKEKAETDYVNALIAINKQLTEAKAEAGQATTQSTTGQAAKIDLDHLQQMLSPVNVQETLKKFQRNLHELSKQIKDGDPGLPFLNACLREGTAALQAPQDLSQAVKFSQVAHELYLQKKDVPAWRNLTGSLLKWSSMTTGGALTGLIGGLGIAQLTVGIGGLAMGTAILGSLTLGGAVAVIAAAIAIYLIAEKLKTHKNATQQESTKLMENAKEIEGLGLALTESTKKPTL